MPQNLAPRPLNRSALSKFAIVCGVSGGSLGLVSLVISVPIQPGQGTVLGGIGVLVGGGLAYWSSHQKRLSDERIATAADVVARQQLEQAKVSAAQAVRHSDVVMAEQVAARQEVHRREVVRDLRSRFALAAEQLSSSSPVIRLAGVYAMVALADDWLQIEPPNLPERQVCVDVLRAYLRAGVDERPVVVNESGDVLGVEADTEVRQTIFRIIADRACLPDEDPSSWSHVDVGLARADLRLIDFSNSTFQGLQLESAMFTAAKFENAIFDRCDLTRADASQAVIAGAVFRNCNLNYATFSGNQGLGVVDFSGSTMNFVKIRGRFLSSTVFVSSNLENASLDGARLWNSNFRNANLSYVDMAKARLNRSDFTGADLSWANLEGASLVGCTFTGSRLDDIWYTDETEWPEGFLPPASRADFPPF